MTDLDRRKFMKQAAATGAVTVGVGTTMASSVSARGEPASRDRAESLLDAHASEVLTMLEDDGVLADRGDLSTTADNDFGGVVNSEEGAAMLSLPDAPEEMRVVTAVDAGTLTVTVQPSADRAFAILDTDDEVVGYNVEQGKYDFGTCTQLLCSSGVRSEECCDDSGDCTYSCGC